MNQKKLSMLAIGIPVLGFFVSWGLMPKKTTKEAITTPLEMVFIQEGEVEMSLADGKGYLNSVGPMMNLRK